MKQITNFSRTRASLPSGMTGLSLVELMIAITIGLLILAGVISVFVNASGARNEIERTSRQIENGRYALEVLTDDLRMAGYYGEFSVGSGTPGALPDPCSVDPVVWRTAMPLHLQGYASGATMPSCLPGTVKSDSPALVVRRVRGCIAGAAGCDAVVAAKGYLQVALCPTEAKEPTTQYVLDVGSGTFPLRLKDCGATTASLREYRVHIYFLSTTNGAGQNIPTLKRMELSGNTFTETALVEGIERLHIEYGIDTNGDGLPDVYRPNPSSAPCAAAPCTATEVWSNWANVMTAQLFVLARNIDPTPGYSDTKTYTLGSLNVTPDAAYLNHRRHVYTSVVRIINPAGRRDTP
jgi:type IV pilus assembly protein PilW